MKIIALLLPQFHRIDENDRWWGKGFTEWTNVKRAVPLYRDHKQPRIPLDENYYDLTDPIARARQASLAKEYGLYGFCYYHYWFEGKQLLEKPLKELLESGEPDYPFCLSWANEPWTRRWDGMESEILMPQKYGDQDDWTRHFECLLEAFRDRRYIRVDGKPLLLIYRPAHIPRCEEMLLHWRKLAVRHGLRGLHLVRTLGGFEPGTRGGFDASMEFEPHYTFAHGMLAPRWGRVAIGGQLHLMADYDRIWESILRRTPHRDGETVYPGAFANWDNTPRKGAEGQSTIGMTPEKLERYLTRQLRKAREEYRSEFVFFNAWNEWAEGAYLEPDQEHGYRRLEAIRRALGAVSLTPIERVPVKATLEEGAPVKETLEEGSVAKSRPGQVSAIEKAIPFAVSGD